MYPETGFWTLYSSDAVPRTGRPCAPEWKFTTAKALAAERRTYASSRDATRQGTQGRTVDRPSAIHCFIPPSALNTFS